MSKTNAPKIVTLESLESFKNQFTDILGIKLNSNINKSLVQINAGTDIKVTHSAIFGINHQASEQENILIAGLGNKAVADNQTVLGTYNNSNSDALFIVGNGSTDEIRSNAFTVLKSGHILGTPLKTSDSLQDILNNLDDSTLITADIVKQINTATDATTILNLVNWQTSTETKLSDLENKINNKDAIELQSLRNEIQSLRKQVSYLISCLTVDKISNAAYKTENEDLIEYYAVGVADYALDADTQISLESSNISTGASSSEVLNTQEGENQ